jgi:MoxR-like ATPase
MTTETTADNTWRIFQGLPDPHDGISILLKKEAKKELELCPPWRNFRWRHHREIDESKLPIAPEEGDDRGVTFQLGPGMAEMVNAALYLRRPLLITGKPGTGKSSLIYAVARELKLGRVLRWPITSRSSLKDALYQYDAIGRLQEAQLQDARPARGSRTDESAPPAAPRIGKYLRLGALGTALLPYKYPRALLIDEIDKSDVDLPNDLLNIFEEGEYEIPELARLEEREKVISVRPSDSDREIEIMAGHVKCLHFPFVIMTSNGEREFPAPFLRRCLRLTMPEPKTFDPMKAIIVSHLGDHLTEEAAALIETFLKLKNEKELATDQLLNALFLVLRRAAPDKPAERQELIDALLRDLKKD